jgi:hypothetical protein
LSRQDEAAATGADGDSGSCLSYSINCFSFLPGAMAAAITAAEAPALVVLRGENNVAFGGVVEVAGL